MRFLVAVLAACVLAGCSTRPVLDQKREAWRAKANAAAPVGAELAVARKWLEGEGLKPVSGGVAGQPGGLSALIAVVPAREWYCAQWHLYLGVKATPEGHVAAYEFTTLGTCL